MNEKAILLVEDNPDDVELTMRALKRNHIANKVVVARDGVEAIEYLHGTGPHVGRDTSDLPVVVLLDVKLPRQDGLETLAKIRADNRTRLLPVAMLTSSNEERDLATAYRDGANSYVRKPVTFEQFSDVVKQLGMYWLLLNEPPPPVH